MREVLPAYAYDAKLDDVIFEKQLSSLRAEEPPFETVDTAGALALAEEALKSRYGTAFIFSDPENADRFELLKGVPRSLFRRRRATC